MLTISYIQIEVTWILFLKQGMSIRVEFASK